MDEKAAIETLRQAKEILDKAGVQYWLDCGTLLGAVRNGRFIPWDNDIDLGIWHKDVNKIAKIIENLHIKGFLAYFFIHTVSLHNTKKDITLNLNIYHKNKEAATWKLFINTKSMKLAMAINYILSLLSEPTHIGDIPSPLYKPMPQPLKKIITKASQTTIPKLRHKLIKIIEKIATNLGCKDIQMIIPTQYFTNLSTINFYEMKLKTPTPVEKYLAYRYGKNWKTPRKNYIYYEEDGAIAKKHQNQTNSTPRKH